MSSKPMNLRYFRKITPVVTVLVLLLAGTILVGSSAASDVNCGDIVTQNTTLTHDLTGCTDGGLIIGANNVVLDLGGYTISAVAGPGDGKGVDTNGFSNVKIKNGTISNFDAGILINGVGILNGTPTGPGGLNEVTDMVLDSNQGDPNTDYGDGVLIAGSSFNKIENNVVNNNGPYDGIGIIGLVPAGPLPSDSNKIEGNTVTDNNMGFAHHGAPSVDDGIRVEPGVTNTVVKENVVTGSGLDNIAVFNTAQNTLVSENYVAGALARNGIQVFNPATAIVRENTVCGNAANGIMMGLGLPVPGPSLILNNNVGAGTDGCAPNGNGTTSWDLADSAMNGRPETPAGVPCGDHVWKGNFTPGDTYNHNCTKNP